MVTSKTNLFLFVVEHVRGIESKNVWNTMWALASRLWLKTICSATGGWRWGHGGCTGSLTANLREPKSLYLSPSESAKGLRTGERRAARFNQPATRLASNPDLQICIASVLYDSYNPLSSSERVVFSCIWKSWWRGEILPNKIRIRIK